MSKSEILAYGEFFEWDAAALDAAFTRHALGEGEPPDRLDEATRAGIRAMALKGHHPIGPEFMDALPALGLIANYGVGYDAVDAEAAKARGIAVTNTPDVLTADVADLAVGLLLAERRRIPAAEAYLRAGRWAAEGNFPLQNKVSGKRVGIVGLGRIGAATARRLAAFDCEIAYVSRKPKDAASPDWRYMEDVVALADWADFLIVTLAGGPETAKAVGREAIAALGPEGVLVNISRGSTVDEEALIEALGSGALGGAALDVFAGEPAPDRRLLVLDNVALSPHQASATTETRKAMGRLMIDNLTAFFDGAPLKTRVV